MNDDLVEFNVLIEGNDVRADVRISRMELSHQINQIPVAVISILNDATLDDGKPQEAFSTDAFKDFLPGNQIEIKAGTGRARNKTIFKGLIIDHAIQVKQGEASVLKLTCMHPCVKLATAPKNAHFQNQTDGNVIKTLVNNAALALTVDDTTHVHADLVQYSVTDWDFLLSRAKASGLFVTANPEGLFVTRPDFAAKPVLTLTYGVDIIELDLKIDGLSQVPSVSASAWHPDVQKLVESQSTEPASSEIGNLKGKEIAKMLATEPVQLHASAPLSIEQLKDSADACLLESRLSKINGTVSFSGSAQPQPGKTIELEGLGRRFNGVGLISGVKHVFEAGQWLTEITLGIPSTSPNVTHEKREGSSTSCLLPGVSGLQIGKVKNIQNDPQGEMRVQVDIPALHTAGGGLWARLGSPYATNDAGFFFMPEIEDEVVLGFLDNDPNYPVILGSLYSSNRSAPVTPDQGNTRKGIVTKGQMKILFDDENHDIQLETSSGQTLSLNDKGASITLKDANNNKVEMSATGITLESAGTILMKAGKQLLLDSKDDMGLATKRNLTMDGLSIDADAKIAFSANGEGSASLKAGGQVTVQGAMVMIN
ncbi:MAG: type VI secretion system tip protein VgrG [Rhodothermales bacterium]